MIAVPCWSSWKTGMSREAFSASSISKHSGRADVLEVDAAEGRRDQLAEADHLLRVDRVDLDVEDVDVGEALEEDALALHHGLAGEGAEVAEAEHGGAVGDDGDEVALGGVLVRIFGVLLDLETGRRDAGGVGEGEIGGRGAALGRDDLDLPGATLGVIFEGLFIETHGKPLTASVGAGADRSIAFLARTNTNEEGDGGPAGLCERSASLSIERPSVEARRRGPSRRGRLVRGKRVGLRPAPGRLGNRQLARTVGEVRGGTPRSRSRIGRPRRSRHRQAPRAEGSLGLKAQPRMSSRAITMRWIWLVPS